MWACGYTLDFVLVEVFFFSGIGGGRGDSKYLHLVLENLALTYVGDHIIGLRREEPEAVLAGLAYPQERVRLRRTKKQANKSGSK